MCMDLHGMHGIHAVIGEELLVLRCSSPIALAPDQLGQGSPGILQSLPPYLWHHQLTAPHPVSMIRTRVLLLARQVLSTLSHYSGPGDFEDS